MSVYLLLFVGALGSFLPVLPGPLIAGIALLGFKLIFPESPVSWALVIAGVAVAIVSQFIDIFATWIGAKKFGATWRGALGAFIGVFVGIFMPPPIIWIFLAPLIFAFGFEWLGGASVRRAANAGIGAFLGSLLASIFKFLSVVFLAVWFSFSVASTYFN